MHPPPKIVEPVSFTRRRQISPEDTDPKSLQQKHRTYLSGLSDGLQRLPNCETLYPNVVAGRYALGYMRGSRLARRPQPDKKK